MRQPLLCLTPATGVLRRYAPPKVRTVPGARSERLVTAMQVDADYLDQLGTPDALRTMENFRRTGTIQ